MPTSTKVLGYALVNCANAYRALETPSPRGQIIWIQDDSQNIATVSLGNVDMKDTELIYAACSTYGNIIACNIVPQKDLANGFIRLESRDSAREVIPKVNEIIAKVLSSHSATEISIFGGGAGIPSFDEFTNVYVKNLDDAVDSAKLIELFSRYGAINSAIVMTEDGISKGFGFVDFELPQSAKRAIKEMNGKKVGSRTLYVARAQSRVDRPDRPKFPPQLPLYN